MNRKLPTAILSLALVLALVPMNAAATNTVRLAETHQHERVPIQNTEAHISTSYKQFGDVSDTYWGKGGISYVVDKGLFNGTGYGMFSPEMPVNRAMICAVLHRFAGSPDVSGSSKYADVKSDEWYTAGVIWVEQKQILPLDLLNSSMLEPERGLTRGEFAVMVRNFFEVSGGSEYNDAIGGLGVKFHDLPMDDYEVTWAMAWLYTYSILNGTSDTTLSPEMGLTRSQLAAILERYDWQFGAGDNSQSSADGTTTTPTGQTSDKQEEDKLIQLINDFRAENGLPRLNKNEKLMEAADVRVREISENFSHVRPDGTYLGILGEEFDAENMSAHNENIVMGAIGAEGAFNAWKNSTAHNGAMLSKIEGITEIGVGYREDGGYAVMLFGEFWK